MTTRQVAIRGTVQDVAADRGISHRDCRECQHFDDQGDGLGYGWCRAHRQFVKLYQMADGFWSQCQFKAITRDRPGG